MKKILFAVLPVVLFGFITAAQPTISSFFPVSGPVGTSVAISGSNFNVTPSDNAVFFGATRAVVTGASATTLNVTVPIGATYQYISVTNLALNQTAYSSEPFICNFSCPNSITTGSFLTNIDSVNSSGINSVATADLDGDGKPDVVASRSSGFIEIYRNISIPGSLRYAPKIETAAGSSLSGIAIGDLDGDGKPDMVIANNSTNSVSVYLNTSTLGNISFAPKADYITGTSPNSVVIGDINGDGKPELAVTNNNSTSVSVFRNQCTPGLNSFAAKVDFPTGTTPKDLCIGDIDNDGRVDLAVASFNTNRLSLLRNTSTGGIITFAPKVDFVTLSNPYGICIGDLNNDGKKEIVVSYFSVAVVSVFRNTSSAGTVSLLAKVDFASGSNAYSVGITDLSGDGVPDLFCGNRGGASISVFENISTTGSISLTPNVNIPSGSAPSRVVATDADGDGRPDLISGNGGSSVSFIRNTGNLGLTITSASALTICTGSTASIPLTSTLPAIYSWGASDNPNTSGETTITQSSSTLSDVISNSSAVVQNINYLVIPTSSTGCGTGIAQTVTISVNPVPSMTSTNNASIPSGATVSIPLTSNISCTYVWQAADNTNVTGESLTTQTTSTLSNTLLNGTSAPEVVAYTVTPTSAFGCGTGAAQAVNVTVNPLISFTSFSPASGPIGTTVIITGVNFNATLSNNIVSFGAVKATVTAGTTSSLTVTVPAGTTYDYITVTDISAGLHASSAKPFITTFTCGGSILTSSLAARIDNTADAGPRYGVCADFDGDGKPDIMNVNSTSNSFTVNRNTSSVGLISTAPKISFITGGPAPRFGGAGDLDGDGKPDVAVSCFNGTQLSVFLNTSTPGTISFAPKVDYTTGTNPSGVSIGDLDGDGRAEIIVANSGSNTISVYKNMCSPGINSFSPKVDFAVGTYPYSIAVGDIDNDGKKDLAVANLSSFNVSVLKNTSSIGTFSFASSITLTVGAAPYTVAMGDLDADGKPDVATCSSGGGVSLFRNTTSGTMTFAPRVDHLAMTPQSLVIADVDGDGKPDITTSCRSANKISLFKNTCTPGTMSLAARVDFTTSSLPEYANVGDIDLDGKQDILVSTSSASIFSIFRNTVDQGLMMSNTSTVTICSGTAVSIPLTSNYPASYTWLAADNLNISGESTSVQTTDTLSNTLYNTASTAQVVNYTITPTDLGGCGVGYPQTVNITVNPLPAMTNTNTASVPSGGTVSIALSSNIPSTYSWIAADNPNTNGESITPQSTGILTNTIISTSSVPQTVVYTVTPTSTAGCAGGIPQTINVVVNPIPTIISFTPLSAETGASVSITGTNFNTNAANNIVFFGGTRAAVTSGTTSSLLVTVPAGAAYQYISVTDSVAGLTAISPSKFAPMFTCGGDVSADYFSPAASLGTQSITYTIVSGDMDGDGKNDLVQANYGTGGTGNKVSVFLNTSTAGSVSFAPRVDLTTAAGPLSVTLADMNGDGKLDIIAGCDPNKASVLLNTCSPGVVSFAPKVDFTTGSLPRSIAASDIDGDARPDIITANYGANSVSVLRNITTSFAVVSFAAKIDFTVPGMCSGISVGDLDADGKVDLINTNTSGNSISIFRNTSLTGTITMAARIDLVSGNGPQAIGIADINADSRLDLISANSSGSVSVFRNYSSAGTINFDPKVDFATGTNTYGLATGDVTGDGQPDIVVSKWSADKVSVLSNTTIAGSVSFGTPFDFSTDATPRYLVISDLNTDGKPEVITANSGGTGTLSVLMNTAYYSPVAIPASGIASYSADLNWNATVGAIDYFLDVAYDSLFTNFVSGFNNANAGNVTTYNLSPLIPSTTYYYRLRVSTATCGLSVNSNVISFTTLGGALPPTISSFSPASGPAGSTVTISGTNFGGTAGGNKVMFGAAEAIITAASATSLTITVPPGTTELPLSVTNLATALTAYSIEPFHLTFPCGGPIAASSMAARVDISPAPSNPVSMVESDFDGDGRIDVALKAGAGFSVYPNTGSPNVISFATSVDSTVSAFTVFAGDVNSDGKPDLILSSYDHVNVFRNTSTLGNISFAQPIPFTTGDYASVAGVYDLTGDGKSDIVVANSDDNTVSVLVNTGSVAVISFAPRVDFNTGNRPMISTLADIDGDGKQDVITANSLGSSVSVLRNTSAGSGISFASYIDFAVDSMPSGLVTGNFAGLGKQDIAVVNNNSTLSILKNTSTPGTVSFAPRVDFAAAYNPRHIALADMNGDGKPDLVVTSTAATISIFSNNGGSGTVSLAPKVDFLVGVSSMDPQATSLGDLDNDGKPDIAVISNSTDGFSVLRNMNYTGANITSVSSNSSCGPGSVTLSAAPSAGVINWYSEPFGGVSLGSGTSFTIPALDSTINYYVDATDAGCTSIPRVNVIAVVQTSVSSFSPASGPVGTTVTINGCGFNPVASNNAVYFGATQATVLSATSNILTVTVPSGATFQTISVSNKMSHSTGYSSSPFVVTFPCGAAVTASSFSGVQDILPPSLATICEHVALGDIDNDGKVDMVIPGLYSGAINLAVLHNTSTPGNISYAAPSLFSGGSDPIEALLFDINSDGKLDVITVDNGSNKISVRKNTSSPGSVSFAPRQEFHAGSNVLSLAAGDLDGDGRPEIAVLNTQYYAGVLRNISLGDSIMFAPLIPFSTDLSANSVSINIADLNGDGKPELMYVASFPAVDIGIYKNQSTVGNISFAPKVTYNAGSSFPRQVKVGDMDGDGKPDIVIGNSNSSTTYFGTLRNTGAFGNISFASLQTYPASSQSGELSLADLNGDGKLDVAVSAPGDAHVSVFTNTSAPGAITFTPRINYSGIYSRDITIADIDGDNKPDMIFGYTGADDNIGVMRNLACETDDVWPGDANHDLIVNNLDLLPIGLHYAQTGSARSVISNSWQPYPALDWGINQTNGEDIKHADCNGDGTINNNDTLAVNLNFSSMHMITSPVFEERTGTPDLYMVSGTATYSPGSWVEVDVMAGNATVPVENLYGLAFNISYDASLVQSGTENMYYSPSWFVNPGTDGISFAKIVAPAATAYGALTRTDHMNTDGYGKIASFRFQLKSTITVPTPMNFSYSGYFANDSAGVPVPLNPLPYSIMVDPLATGVIEEITSNDILVHPNPFTGNTLISYGLSERAKVTIEIFDAIGHHVKTIFSGEQFAGKYNYNYTAEEGHESGVYFLRMVIGEKTIMKKLIEIK
jgi:hypothetical protein